MTIRFLTGDIANMPACLKANAKQALKVLGLWLCVCSSISVAQGVFDYPIKAGSAEAQTLEFIAAELRQNLPLNAAVEQQKYLTVLREPMISTGALNLTADGDLHWRIVEPFAVSYSMTAGELTRTMDGSTEVISASAEPALYGFFQLFSRLFELSLQELNNYFAVYLLPQADTGERWVIGLTPEDARLKKVLAHIIVQGKDGAIAQVTLTEPGDDYTVLTFSNIPADKVK